MESYKLLGNYQLSLTTASADVTMPGTFTDKQLSSSMIVACRDSAGNAYREWIMISPDGDEKTYPDYNIPLDFNVGPNTEPFSARVSSGTGTLEISFLK